jgi:hypothetical protein
MIAERFRSQEEAYETKFDRKIGLKASYLSKQIDTFIGERLNVLLSKSKYEIKNNSMYGKDMDEPFINVIKRGVDYKERAEGRDRVDRKREEAEIEGFQKIQEIMCNPNTEIGTMVLSVSPKGGAGSLYERNFYDIFTLEESQGKRFVEARRYSSALTINEYKEKLSPLVCTKDIVDDADWLKKPVKIDNLFFENADRAHAYLHKDHPTVELSQFEKVINNKKYEAFKWEYYKNPNPKTLDAIKNLADEIIGFAPLKISKTYLDYHNDVFRHGNPFRGTAPLTTMAVAQEIDFYGGQKVRQVATGCGSSGSSSKDLLDNSIESLLKDYSPFAPFSVAEFGSFEEKYEFDQEGPCKKCKSDSKCGPCGLCETCDLAIRASQKFSLN